MGGPRIIAGLLAGGLVVVACASGASDDARPDGSVPATSSNPITTEPADTTGITTATANANANANDDANTRWIGVDGDRWIDRRTGDVFVPRGVNLILKRTTGGDVMFADYDPDWVARQLDAIATHGFNTVRFFLDMCMACTSTPDGIRSDYLDDLADLLTQMAARDLVAFPTSNDVPDPGYSDRLPCCEPFGGYRNSLYLSAEGHDIAIEYWTDLITGLHERDVPLDHVMGWELANEQFFLRDVPPISLTSGSVTTADGTTYDLSDDAAVQTMVEQNLLAFIANVGAAIRTVDPGAMVSIGQFYAEEPEAGRTANDNRWVVPDVVIRDADVEFLDLHAYSGFEDDWDTAAAGFGLDEPVDKPLLLGEFGAFEQAYGDAADGAIAVAAWQAESCRWGFDGWLAWLWGASTDDEVITLNAGDDEIAVALSPSKRPDPCDVGDYVTTNLAVGRPIVASQEESAEYAAARVNDGSVITWWSAADGAPQWVDIDLEAPQPIGRVDIVIGDVAPPGPMTYRVYVRSADDAGPGTFVGEISADARDGEVLTVTVDPTAPPAQIVRVEVAAIDGWVIVHEIEVHPS